MRLRPVSVHEHLALVVVVLQEARVLQQMVCWSERCRRSGDSDGRHLNELVSGKTASEIARIRRRSRWWAVLLDVATTLLDGADEMASERAM